DRRVDPLDLARQVDEGDGEELDQEERREDVEHVAEEHREDGEEEREPERDQEEGERRRDEEEEAGAGPAARRDDQDADHGEREDEPDERLGDLDERQDRERDRRVVDDVRVLDEARRAVLDPLAEAAVDEEPYDDVDREGEAP